MTKEEFQKRRTQIISEMFDNPNESGIYPIAKCYEALDELYEALRKPDVIKSVCGCGYDGTYEKDGLIFCQCCDNRKI